MANAPPPRPQPFPTGMELSKHYRVEALVRLSGSRMIYLVTDGRQALLIEGLPIEDPVAYAQLVCGLKQ